MNEEWANNPNLKNIDPLKLKILNEFVFINNIKPNTAPTIKNNIFKVTFLSLIFSHA